MHPKAGYFTPMLHVADVAASIRFYESLGFELIDTEGGRGHISWARLHAEGSAIMLFEAEEPIPPGRTSVMLYAYTGDLPALRRRLLDAGVQASAVNHPPYMPSGEITVKDPDGNPVFIAHWGDAEHSAWLEKVEDKKRSGTLRVP